MSAKSRWGLEVVGVLSVWLVVAAGPTWADDLVLVPREARWSFLPGLAEPQAQGDLVWQDPAYDVSAWEELPASFGYGDPPFTTDLSAREPPMEDNYTSIYLRREFEVRPDADLIDYRLLVDYDDGFVVWINGIEALRVNVRGEDDDPLTFESRARTGRESGELVEFLLPEVDRFVAPGSTAVLAVQALNVSIGSNDFHFDCELIDPFGPDIVAPRIAELVPAAGAVVRRLTRVSITFDEAVQGVDASDLLVGGVPASGVEGEGAGPWVFTFAQPAVGEVAIAWAEDADIIDLAPARNALAGGEWTYRLDPLAPPPTVRINEVLASNIGGLVDEDDSTPDWIEVLNFGAAPVSLAGWTLSDDPGNTALWAFPDVVLGPGEHLVVFASGKDRRDPSLPLHTSFRVAAGGGYLGLFTAEFPPTVVSELELPEQRPDHSWGYDVDGRLGYLVTPTPGETNEGPALVGLVREPRFDAAGGHHDGPFDLTLTTRTVDATIRYTLDGTVPTRTNGTVVDGPIRLEGASSRAVVTVRAAAFRDGFVPSRTVTRTFIFAAHVVSQPARPDGFPLRWGSAPGVDYEMDPEIVGAPGAADAVVEGLRSLPSLSIVMDVDALFGPSGIYSNPQGEGVAWERPCSMEVLPVDGSAGIQIDCGLRIFGGASRRPDRSPKHSLRFLFKGIYGATKLRYPLFPDSDVEEFDTISLRGNYNNSWIHWDSGQRRRGLMLRDQWAKDVQLAMGQPGAHGRYFHVWLNGLYWGVYDVVERPSAPFAAAHMGGEKEEYDALNSGNAVDGNTATWSAMMGAVNAVGADPDALAALGRDHLDLDNLADYMLLNFYGANQDWDDHNWYAARRRGAGGLWRFFSWDAERILENVGDNRTTVNLGGKPSGLHSRLRSNAEYRRLFGDRAHRHLFQGGALTPERAAEAFIARADEVEAAVVAESARWGDYRRDVHSAENGPFELYRYAEHWLPERTRLVDTYFPRRTDALLAQLRRLDLYPAVEAPIPSLPSGEIEPGAVLALTLPEGQAGVIWLTLDGSDPRQWGSGTVAPTAMEYGGPIALGDFAIVRARTLADGEWSALSESVYSVLPDYGALRVTEIHYAPAEGSDLEFVEIANLGERTVSLAGVEVEGGIDLRFSETDHIAAGEARVIVADAARFAEAWPQLVPLGEYTGRLDNGGESFRLVGPSGDTILEVEYDDADFWPLAADGFGRSLTLADDSIAPTRAEAWRSSTNRGGSPGELEDADSPWGSPRISEVLASLVEGQEQYIEIHNPGDRAIDLGAWWLSDRRGSAEELRKHRLADGTSLAPGGFLVITEGEFGGAFRLSALGDEIYLAAFDEAGEVAFLTGVDFGAAEAGVPYGAHETTLRMRFSRLVVGTPGTENAAPLVGDVVLNEIHYHPAEGGVEFVELLHRGATPIDLAAGWELGGVDGLGAERRFTFPPEAVLDPGALLLVVPIEPADFRALHDVPADTIVVGPWDGALDNGGERVSLWQPIDLFGVSSAVRADAVRFDDESPWPLEADGSGPSLERVDPGAFGDDPAAWAAALVVDGTPGRPNSTGVPEDGGLRLPSDADGDGRLTLSDAVSLLGHLFRASPVALPCGDGTITDEANVEVFDANGDGGVNLSDGVWVLNHLFAGGAPPVGGVSCRRVVGCPDACALP